MATHPFITSGGANAAIHVAGVKQLPQQDAKPPEPTLESFIGKPLADQVGVISGDAGKADLADEMKSSNNNESNLVIAQKKGKYYNATLEHLKSASPDERAAILKAAAAMDNPETVQSFGGRAGAALDQFFKDMDWNNTFQLAHGNSPDQIQDSSAMKADFNLYLQRAGNITGDAFQNGPPPPTPQGTAPAAAAPQRPPSGFKR